MNAGYPGLATAEPGRGSTGFFNILLKEVTMIFKRS
jgi:hypothetical protein